MNKLTRISATVASSVALVAGFTGLAGAASIDRTGYGSDNRIKDRSMVRSHVDNDTDVDLKNNNPQVAVSGDAEADKNTDGDEVMSGDAENEVMVDAMVEVDNSGAAGAAQGNGGAGWSNTTEDAEIRQTGAHSENVISSSSSMETEVENDTDVQIANNNSQVAVSGDAEADKNTSAGNVQSGDAMNVSNATFKVHVSN
ncbi:MAG TPA: hypothetical protein VK978_02360 [Candidatus Saccharimonadales bacterium]|nr:hypothetical protein [Candidatus Saccharimonadales bacterium]